MLLGIVIALSSRYNIKPFDVDTFSSGSQEVFVFPVPASQTLPHG